MASQPALDPDVERVRQALGEMFRSHADFRIEVFRSSGPYLRAIVVSDEFAQEGATSRQKRVWEHLRQTSLGPELLNRLFSVHPYTWSEFREEFQET